MNAAEAPRNPIADDLDHILTHTAALWESVRGEAIFVTGGTGFFGRWLLESFAYANAALKLNARIVVLSRAPDAFKKRAPHLAANPSVRFVSGDVRHFDSDAVREQLGGYAPQFRYVIHAATEASAKLNAEDPLKMADTIVQGTRSALEFACAVGAKRFLLTSSGAVYGTQPDGLTHIPEDYAGGPDPTNPASAYGEAKRMAELLCACFEKQHGIEPLIARCFAFVGPFLPLEAHFAIGNFIRDALAGGPIRVGGDGTPFRSYLYAADLVIWLWAILFRGEAMRPYNVGSGNEVSIRALAETVRDSTDPALQIEVAQTAKPGALPSYYVPDVSRINRELDLIERIPLHEGIRRTAEFGRGGLRLR